MANAFQQNVRYVLEVNQADGLMVSATREVFVKDSVANSQNDPVVKEELAAITGQEKTDLDAFVLAAYNRIKTEFSIT